jgi:hypothetical protein
MVPTLPTNVPVPVHMQKTSALNFDKHASDTFTLIDDFELDKVLDNIILVRYVDTPDSNQTVMRNGILVPIDHTKAAWRIGQIILAGPDCKNVKVDDYVCFPNDKGIPVSNVVVRGLGKIKQSIFLDETRIFGVCSKAEQPAVTMS